MKKKYGIRSLKDQFPNDGVILDFIFDTLHSRKCSCGGSYKPLFSMDNAVLVGRRQYQCSKCRYQIAPTAGTIFHKSDTPLTLWFHAILVFANAKSSVSAKYLERELEVTYKTAWRMLRLIRKALPQSDEPLSGDVEFDEGYIGGAAKQKNWKKNKSTVLAAVQRGGEMRAAVMPDGSAKSHMHFLWQNVSTKNTRLMTDGTNRLDVVARGYDRHEVDHNRKQYVKGDVHVNHVESFWAHIKRSVKGTHKVVSKKHLQSYVDAFVWHYNQRTCTDAERFALLLGALTQPAK